MRILIFGVNGMLGHKLYQGLVPEHSVTGTIRGRWNELQEFGIFPSENVIEDVSISDLDSLRRSFETSQPDVVINAIGLIKQAPSSKSVVQALSVNSIFPHQLSAMAAEFSSRLILISTDCVFAGTKGSYTEDDPPDANDLYGLSKRLGEVLEPHVLELRTSVVGRELANSHSIVEWFLGKRGSSVKGFRKAIYTGLTTIELTRIISRVIADLPELSGLWHVSSDPISKFDLLNLLNRNFGASIDIIPDDEVVIDRSLDSTRFRNRTGLTPPSWESMIAEMAADPTPYDHWRPTTMRALAADDVVS
jgi:dTDP-4-dehydrorhamnose reductase